MSPPCRLVLGSDVYYPGQTIYGRVNCIFSKEEKVRGIRVKFKGRAKVQWKAGQNTTYNAEEIYFEMVSDVLRIDLGETIFPPGTYSYTFEFHLPYNSPSTLEEIHGNIKYYAEAVVDRPWAIDYTHKLPFRVCSTLDLNMYDVPRCPVDVTETKKPHCLFNKSDPIEFSVHLPLTGYVPSQMVSFFARVKNNSNVNIRGVQFKLVQGFRCFAEGYMKEEKTFRGQVYEIIDSRVNAGNEKFWDLKLEIRENFYKENLQYCNIIKSFVELKGKVILPLPHRNMKICIPLTIGSVPYQEYNP